MKSIKRGRGPSMMNCAGAVIAVLFGIFWTVTAVSMGAPFFFPIFGILFIIIGIVQAVYSYKNATGKNRFSEFDITETGEEPDPIDRYISGGESQKKERTGKDGYCPYCGKEIEKEYDFCPRCGKKLPPD